MSKPTLTLACSLTRTVHLRNVCRFSDADFKRWRAAGGGQRAVGGISCKEACSAKVLAAMEAKRDYKEAERKVTADIPLATGY